jgi:thiol-disulfide isomerase/thioredoxin
MKFIYLLLIILLIVTTCKQKEHYVSYTPYELENISVKDNSYGYPSYYTPINDFCGRDPKCPYVVKRKNIENFQVKYKTCVPIATLTLYSSKGCGHCKNFMPEWNKYVKQIRNNCRYNKLIKVVHKKDDEITEKEYKLINYAVPSVLLKVHADKLNKKKGRIIEFNGERTAKGLEDFVIRNIRNQTDFEYDDHEYVDCKKGKMLGKYWTLCDNEHKDK